VQASSRLRIAQELRVPAARVRVGSILLIVAMLAGVFVTQRIFAAPQTSVDLSTYVRVGRFGLPEPTRTTPPANSLLAQEASAVTYNWDTDTLFVVGDGGTSVVQVTKTGQLIDSMTLAPGNSPRQHSQLRDDRGSAARSGQIVICIDPSSRLSLHFRPASSGRLRQHHEQQSHVTNRTPFGTPAAAHLYDRGHVDLGRH